MSTITIFFISVISLIFLVIIVPLVFISSRGFKRDSDRGHKNDLPIISIAKLVINLVLIFFIIPCLLVFLINFFNLVLKGGVPFSEFMQNLPDVSYEPVIKIYMRLWLQIRHNFEIIRPT